MLNRALDALLLHCNDGLSSIRCLADIRHQRPEARYKRLTERTMGRCKGGRIGHILIEDSGRPNGCIGGEELKGWE